MLKLNVLQIQEKTMEAAHSVSPVLVCDAKAEGLPEVPDQAGLQSETVSTSTLSLRVLKYTFQKVP